MSIPLAAMGVLSLIVGSLGALRQVNFKCFVGFSGIAQTGYLLLALWAMSLGDVWGQRGFVVYAYGYGLAAGLLWVVWGHLSCVEGFRGVAGDATALLRRNASLAGGFVLLLDLWAMGCGLCWWVCVV